MSVLLFIEQEYVAKSAWDENSGFIRLLSSPCLSASELVTCDYHVEFHASSHGIKPFRAVPVSTNEEVCCSASHCHMPNDQDKSGDTQELPLGDFTPY